MEITAEEIMEGIIDGLREIFPETEYMDLNASTTLGEMPEWDAIAAVNLQTHLLQQFEIEVPLELLSDETTLVEIMTFLKRPVDHEAI